MLKNRKKVSFCNIFDIRHHKSTVCRIYKWNSAQIQIFEKCTWGIFREHWTLWYCVMQMTIVLRVRNCHLLPCSTPTFFLYWWCSCSQIALFPLEKMEIVQLTDHGWHGWGANLSSKNNRFGYTLTACVEVSRENTLNVGEEEENHWYRRDNNRPFYVRLYISMHEINIYRCSSVEKGPKQFDSSKSKSIFLQ